MEQVIQLMVDGLVNDLYLKKKINLWIIKSRVKYFREEKFYKFKK